MAIPDPQHATPQRTSVFISRRNFIQFGIAAVGAAWAGTLVQNALYPIQSASSEAQPVSFPLADLPVGATKALSYGATPVLVVRSAESIRAFSLICTHLGCQVQWQPGSQEFYCPCHDGRFDSFGEVLAGPPPLPLEEFPVRMEGDQVIVGEVV